jgi:hypothetical protein
MNLTDWLYRQIANADVVLESFREAFEGNPANALDGSRRAFEAAAMRAAAAEAVVYLDSQGEAYTLSVLKDRLSNAAQSPTFSTSPTSNLMAQYSIAALAKIVAKLEGPE